MPSPDVPGDATAETVAPLLAELLSDRFAEKPGLVLLDEADAMIEANARVGFPLLSELRTLQAEGVCSFVLPALLVEHVGGYPNLVQLVCDELLEDLKHTRRLVLGSDELERAERGSRVRKYLVEAFGYNALEASQVLVYLLLENKKFTFAEAQTSLEDAVGRRVPVRVVQVRFTASARKALKRGGKRRVVIPPPDVPGAHPAPRDRSAPPGRDAPAPGGRPR